MGSQALLKTSGHSLAVFDLDCQILLWGGLSSTSLRFSVLALGSKMESQLVCRPLDSWPQPSRVPSAGVLLGPQHLALFPGSGGMWLQDFPKPLLPTPAKRSGGLQSHLKPPFFPSAAYPSIFAEGVLACTPG